ncbi:hypothetical protein ACFE04_023311 [Oxalis oulophora]
MLHLHSAFPLAQHAMSHVDTTLTQCVFARHQGTWQPAAGLARHPGLARQPFTKLYAAGEAYGIQIRSTLIGFGNGFQASPPHRMLSKALELSNKTAFNFADRATSLQTKFIPRFSRQCRVFFFPAPNVERPKPDYESLFALIESKKSAIRAYVMASLDMRIIYGVFRAAKNNQAPPSGSCLAREDDGTCLAGVPGNKILSVSVCDSNTKHISEKIKTVEYVRSSIMNYFVNALIEFHLELPKKQHSSERLFLLANPKKIDEIPMINFC